MSVEGQLPDGVILTDLQPHEDERGSFTELHRDEWQVAAGHVQWNAVYSEPGVLRGVHVHPRHDDYAICVSGSMFVGLCDLRPESATYRAAACVGFTAEEPCSILIPHGVAHGFYTPEKAMFVYSVSHYWATDDELECQWNDPELGIPWPTESVSLSQRDQDSGSLAALIDELEAVTRTA